MADEDHHHDDDVDDNDDGNVDTDVGDDGGDDDNDEKRFRMEGYELLINLSEISSPAIIFIQIFSAFSLSFALSPFIAAAAVYLSLHNLLKIERKGYM